MLRLLAMLALLLQALDARAQQQVEDRAGDLYEIRLVSESQSAGDDSSGHSRISTTLVERVISVRDDGVELEFNLPEQTPAEDRARAWQFPVRVFKSPERPLQLLNGDELETRNRAWLQLGKLTQAACGRWTFTWTMIKIECDPQSVLQMLEPFDLRPGDLRDGALHRDAQALELAPLRAGSLSSGGATFVSEMKIDPDIVRRERVEADVAVAELMGQEPLVLEATLQKRAAERISGTMVITFETDASGRVTGRTRITSVVITDGNGSPQLRKTTETVERRLVSPS
jgi:hypothetical protein